MSDEIRRARDAIQLETVQFAELHRRVLEAQDTEDFLARLSHFREFPRRAVKSAIVSFRGCPPEYSDWILNLTIQNMHDIYDQSWSWSESVKEFELKEPAANYLIAIAEEPIGFVHFRFEEQMNELVLYIYDIQIEPEAQRHGLGTFLENACEFIALEKKAARIMAMVFKANEAGLRFFARQGFQAHPLSPEVLNPEKSSEFQHVILGKTIGRRRSSSAAAPV
jgi:ribosomal protein S18 acetylase RimI-like enzyme